VSVIIDQFKVVVDSQNQQEESQPANESPAQQAQPELTPHVIATVFEQMQNRSDRVLAH
jgi:hypothetical protein